MLVLSRKRNESILIGEARIVVVSIEGNKVRLGIQAPPEVQVLRGELHEKLMGKVAAAIEKE